MRGVPFWLGTYFGSGLSPVMPGTMGAALGALTIAFLPTRFYGPIVGALILFFLFAAPRIADRFVEGMKVKDPQSFVLDEALGVWIAAFWPTNPGPGAVILAFLFFRVFDIVKPWPIRAIERLPKGIGVVYDDVAAGVCAFGLVRLFSHFHWFI